LAAIRLDDVYVLYDGKWGVKFAIAGRGLKTRAFDPRRLGAYEGVVETSFFSVVLRPRTVLQAIPEKLQVFRSSRREFNLGADKLPNSLKEIVRWQQVP
jgi:hypothetical protein